jgi:hypothetical protein
MKFHAERRQKCGSEDNTLCEIDRSPRRASRLLTLPNDSTEERVVVQGLASTRLVKVPKAFVELEDHVRFEVFTAVTMKNGVFWDVTPCGSCKKRRFGGT